MTPFTAAQAQALRTMRRVWPEDRIVVVGAMAVACHLDVHWRRTEDLDLCVVTSIQECDEALRTRGWRRNEKVEHSWEAPGRVRVDVLPVQEAELAAGTIEWPIGGARMSTIGLRLALADHVALSLATDVIIRVASIPSLTVLKMLAYLDRPYEREADLSDLAFMLHGYVADDADERWGAEVIDLQLDYEDVSPYLLGRRIRSLANEAESGVVNQFISTIGDERDPFATLARMTRLGPVGWRDPSVLSRRIEALTQGFVG